MSIFSFIILNHVQRSALYCLSTLQGWYRLLYKRNNSFFRRAFWWKYVPWSRELSRELFPYSLYARQCYLKGSLRKKHLMPSFVERRKKIHRNIEKHIFQYLIAKFDQKRYSTLPQCYTGLFTGCSTEEASNNFFFRAF